jgi:uncharacterized protein
MMPAVVLLVVLLMAAGVVGSVVPFLPGSPLIFLGALLFAVTTDFDPVGGWELLLLALLTISSYALEQVSSAFGAAKLGGGRWAALGAIVGGIVGLFFGLVGVLLGPVLGAVGFELVHRKQIGPGLKSGVGTMVGMLLGAVAKFSLAVVMVGLFALWTLKR